MKVGVWLPCYRRWVGHEEARRVAEAAEGLGFGSLWVQDHLVAPTGSREAVELQSSWLDADDYGNKKFDAVQYYGEENRWLDPYALWGFLAGATRTIELASGVIVLPYRDPVAQAKMLGTLDVLSGGRMAFGIGVGHVEAEFETLGIDYRKRGRLTDEYLDVITGLLGGVETSFHGETIDLPPVLPLIEPVQKPRPPFLIGGGSKAAVRRAVDRGDGWLPAHIAPDGVRVGLEYMSEYAAERGRAPVPASVVLTDRMEDPARAAAPSGRRKPRSTEEMRELIAEYDELGVERLAIDLPGPNVEVLLRQMELLAAAAVAA
jgi:probable F420-dependent oxidoreductase